MEPFDVLDAVAVPLAVAKIDTGMIVPARFHRQRRRPGVSDYARAFLHDLRHDAAGTPRPECALNDARYAGARILVAGADFGCGSSRESAAYAVLDYGLRALVASSFGDVFAGNCLQNGILPVVLPEATVQRLLRLLEAQPGARVRVDLPAQQVRLPDDSSHGFDIDPTRKDRLARGLDDVGVTLTHLPQIEAFEQQYLVARPWLRCYPG